MCLARLNAQIDVSVLGKLYNYLMKFNLINNQYGFRKDKSSTLACF